MKRIHKYRIWDKEDKILYKPLPLKEIIEAEWELEGKSEDGRCTLPLKDYLFFSHKHTIWTESTGLKDAKGKFIFVGDILLPMKYPEDGEIHCAVIFEDGAYRKYYKEWDNTLPKPILNKHQIDLHYYVVIDNVFENKTQLDFKIDRYL